VIARPDRFPRRPRIVLLGTQSAYSDAALRTLAELGHAPVAIVRPRGVPGVSGVREVRPALGTVHACPVYEAGRPEDPEAVALCERLLPELLIAACHPLRVPPAWLALPALGGWNIHPSLLPAYRGPVPVFWQLRAGETRTGVTLHRMDEGFDTGPVLAQHAVALPEGARAPEIDALLAENGAALVADVLARGDVVGAPQDERLATRHPLQSRGDLELPPHWTARHAFDFVRGAVAWGPFRATLETGIVLVADALGWQPLPSPPPLAAGHEAILPFADGWVHVRRADA
jgi:methionyl-tRNA formyltransferase